MTIKEMIAVMTAFDKGEAIQIYNFVTGCWEENTDPDWNWQEYKYRIYQEEVIEDIRNCRAFTIDDSSKPVKVIAKTYEQTGCYWKELCSRLTTLGYIDEDIILDLTFRNGNHNNLFVFRITNDERYIPCKPYNKKL